MAVAPVRQDGWWYKPFQPQPPPTNNQPESGTS
jgi:hypothetical protein